jgi:hypothetical protein
MDELKTWFVCFGIAFFVIHGYYFVEALKEFRGDFISGDYVFEQHLVGAFVAIFWIHPDEWWLIYLGMTLALRIVWG